MTDRSPEGFTELTAAFVQADEHPPEGEADAPVIPEAEAVSPEAEPAVVEPEAEAQRVFRFRPAVYAAFGALAALVVSAAVAVPVWRAQTATERREAAVQRVAERFVRNLTTFDYRTLDADIAAIERDATGNFRGELETALGGDITLFRDTIVEAEAHSSGRIHAVVVGSVDGDTASVQAFVDQSIRNKDNPQPRNVLRRIELTLVETTSGWKIDKVRAPGVGPA